MGGDKPVAVTQTRLGRADVRFLVNSACAVVSMPGVQKPHCNA